MGRRSRRALESMCFMAANKELQQVNEIRDRSIKRWCEHSPRVRLNKVSWKGQESFPLNKSHRNPDCKLKMTIAKQPQRDACYIHFPGCFDFHRPPGYYYKLLNITNDAYSVFRKGIRPAKRDAQGRLQGVWFLRERRNLYHKRPLICEMVPNIGQCWWGLFSRCQCHCATRLFI